MKVSRRAGAVRVKLDRTEVGVLDGVLADLESALGAMAAGDAVWDRLHPAAYADADAAREFASLVDDEHDAARAARLGQCRTELAESGGTLDLADDVLERWLVCLNDVRLALGTRLGVTAEDDLDLTALRDDPGRMLYGWLTWLQDSVVTAAMG